MSYAKRIYEEQRMEEIAWGNKQPKRDWRFEELAELEKQNQKLTEHKPKT